MANTIKIKQSSTASAIPLPGELVLGELAINTTDGKLFCKKGDLSIVEIGGTPTTLSGVTLTDYGETSNVIGTAGATQDIDLSLGNVVTMTVSGATTLTFTTTHTNTSFTLLITNAGTNVTWPTIKWEGGTEPTWTVTGDDLVTLTKIGTVWIAGALIGVA